jgi:hypothetical protein
VASEAIPRAVFHAPCRYEEEVVTDADIEERFLRLSAGTLEVVVVVDDDA